MFTPPARTSTRNIWLGVVLLCLGLSGHLLAAKAIGGSATAYGHHTFGFFLILAVTGIPIAALGWRFWRGRRDVTLLIVGAVQALFGLAIYLNRFSIS